MLLIVRKEEVAFWLLDVIVGNLLPGIHQYQFLSSQSILSLFTTTWKILTSELCFAKVILKKQTRFPSLVTSIELKVE